MNRYLLPPGTYVLSDPCYVIAEWDEFLDAMWSADYGLFDYKDKPCCVFSTKYGDGCYDSNKGHMLGVDAGLIGLVHRDVTRNSSDEGELNIVVLKEPTTCYYEDNGTMHFGDLKVFTGDEDERGDEDYLL